MTVAVTKMILNLLMVYNLCLGKMDLEGTRSLLSGSHKTTWLSEAEIPESPAFFCSKPHVPLLLLFYTR